MLYPWFGVGFRAALLGVADKIFRSLDRFEKSVASGVRIQDVESDSRQICRAC